MLCIPFYVCVSVCVGIPSSRQHSIAIGNIYRFITIANGNIFVHIGSAEWRNVSPAQTQSNSILTMSLKRFYLRFYPPGLGLCSVDERTGAEHVQMIDLLDFNIEYTFLR